MRVLAPAALVGALLLVGCTAGGSAKADASGADCLAGGSASSGVKVSGSVGEDLKLTSKTPVSAKNVERSVLKEGSGDVVKEGQNVLTSMTLFNGADGSVLQQLPASEIAVDKDGLTEWAYDGLRCATTGEQIALAAPYDKVFTTDPADSGLEGVTKDDSLVIVMEFGEISDAQEDATADTCDTLTPRDEKYPEIDLGDGSAEPKITIPECMEPPTESESKVLTEGDGAVVAEGDTIMTNYVGVDWNGAVRFDGNWSETGIEFSTAPGALIEGFRSAMIGQKIGSVIEVTMTPEDGYNDGMTRTFVLELVSKA
ncbi:FKBP-type peptidyl-prolyl cis-trans isomerase [Leucobacter japonicus]|uniref:FKBP-type peptidyl-prolyl cis-trans isomerase n=1 Tax=Leucobacter japonicus TaxID=1461259 RepID=UPI0006A7E155|nr:FKBP-type peptidyl-prolyl cis-trans isomerase [Leucobacter japonicus]